MDWSELIARYGFPIVCCIALAWYVFYQTKSFRDELKEERATREAMQKEFHTALNELQEAHNEESRRTIEALNNNTLALQRLSDRLDSERSEEVT